MVYSQLPCAWTFLSLFPWRPKEVWRILKPLSGRWLCHMCCQPPPLTFNGPSQPGALQRHDVLTLPIRKEQVVVLVTSSHPMVPMFWFFMIFKTSKILHIWLYNEQYHNLCLWCFKCVALRREVASTIQMIPLEIPTRKQPNGPAVHSTFIFDPNYDSNTPFSILPVVLLHNGLDLLYCLQGCVLLFNTERLICWSPN